MSEMNEILERIAAGIEKLGEDPVIQMETAPPVCPKCEKINPVIRVEESGGVGLMAEFVIRAKCEHCGTVFYALPLQWDITERLTEMNQMVQARREIGGYGNGNNGSQ